MADYVKFQDSINQKKGDEVIPDYTGLLTDIKYCINLLEELESDRGFKDWVSDWVVGERSSLNIDRTRNNLRKLHEEIEKGLRLHMNLSSLTTKAKMVQQSLKLRIDTMGNSGIDTSPLMITYDNISNTNDEFYTRVSTAVDNLENTGMFVKKKIKINKTATAVGVVGTAAGTAGAIGTTGAVGIGIATGTVSLAMGSALAVSTGGVALVAAGGIAAIVVIGLVAHSYGKKKGVKYHELKFLSESLHDVRLLAEFESHHSTLDEIIIGFKENIEFYEKVVLASIQNFAIQTKAPTPAPTKSQPTLNDGIKATRIYDKTLQENIQSLQESEPEMSEEMRKRMAIKLAEAVCKSFLKEQLNYSETEIGEFLEKII